MSHFSRKAALFTGGLLSLSACDTLIEPGTGPLTQQNVTVASTDTWPGLFDPFTVLSLHLQMNPADWDVVRHDLTNSIELPALFHADGETPIAVTVRRKSSRALPSEANPIKVGLKVKTVSGRWHGVTTLSLENGGDVGVAAEGFAWNLHEMASVDGYYGADYHPALASWVRLYINGDYIGVYTNVEQRNKQFLRNRFGTSLTGLWFYEVDDIDGWALEAGEPHSPTFTALCFAPFQPASSGGGGGGRGGRARSGGGCATPSDAQLEGVLDQYIDMRAMLVQGAIDAFTDNGDALFSHGKNFSFVDFGAPFTGTRRYYPWDLDAVFRKVDGSIYGTAAGKNKFTQSPYQSVILNHPAFRAQYNTLMLGLVAADGPLAVDKLHAFLNAAEAAVGAAIDEDPYAVGEFGSAQFADLRSWVAQRIPNVQAQVKKNQPAPR